MKRAAIIVLALAAVAVAVGFAGRGPSSSARAVAAAAPTWDDVAPVFAEKCTGCHVTGGIAPFSLTRAKSAAQHAQLIKVMTQANAMPPWMPGTDSPSYLGGDRRVLTAAEKDLIARWVDSGAKLGRAKPLARPTANGGAPGTTLTLEPARSYVPHATGGGFDDYHCFVLDPKLAQDVFVTSAVVKPQRPQVVHHVILFEATGENATEARQLNARSGGNGWTCFGGPGLAETRPTADSISSERLGSPQWISAWVPGHTTNALPSGTGVLVHKGALVVMQVHYNLLRGAAADRSRVVLKAVPAAGSSLTPLDTYLVPAPVELPCPNGDTTGLCSRTTALQAEAKKYGRDAALIPLGLMYLCNKTLADYPQQVGDARSIQTSCTRTVTRPLRIYGVAGHMHTRGYDIRVELNSKTLLHIPRWNFHWQDAYYLAQPVDASPGDTIRVSCRFDNSGAAQPVIKGKRAAPRYVLWGEGTTDEMCLGLLQVAAR